MALALDNIGRKIDSTNMSLGELKSLVGTMMKSEVGAARPASGASAGSDAPNESMVKVRELLEQYTKDFAKEMSEQKGFLSDVVENLKEMLGKKDEKRAERKDSPAGDGKPTVSKEEKSMNKAINGLYQAGVVKRHSLASADAVTHAKLDQVVNAIGSLAAALGKSGGGGGGRSGGGGGGGGGAAGGGAAGGPPAPKTPKIKKLFGFPVLIDDEDKKKDIFYMNYMDMMLHKIAKLANDVQVSFLGWNAWTVLTKGLIDEERKFTQEIRATAYETAGATKEAKSLQHAYEGIGKTAAATGMDRTAFQESYKKALRSGVRELKTAVAMTTAQLNVENQLGLKAGELQDTFQEWNLAGRMTVGQMADMGRGMRDVAKFTGMTGEALKQAVTSSKPFIDALRNAATLTAAAAKNVIEIGANAKKLGIEGEMAPLMKAMASSSSLLLDTSAQTQALLFTAAGSVGRIDDLMNGTILRSKAGIKDMAKGINNVLKRFGVESVEAIDQLSDTAKRDLNLTLKATFGLELGQLRSQYEALNEAGKGYADRLAEINKKMAKNLTVEERAVLVEEARALKTSKALDVLTALDEAAKGAKDMGQALNKFGERRKEFDEDLKAMGVTAVDNAGVAKGAIENALASVNEGLKKAKKSEVKVDASEIERALKDPTAMRELTAKISKGQQELSTAQKAQMDPMTEMAQSLREINDNMRNFTQGLFSKMFDSWVGKMLAGIGVVAGIVAGLALTFAQGRAIWESMKDLAKYSWKWLLQKFGKDVDVEDKKVEAELKKIEQAIDAESKKESDSFGQMIKLLAEIRDCVCRDKATTAAQATAPATTEAKTPAIENTKRGSTGPKIHGLQDPKVAKAELQAIKDDNKMSAVEKKMAMRNVVLQRKDIVMQKKDIKSQKQGDKIQNAQQALVGQQTQTAQAQGETPCPAAPGTECFDPAALMKSGGDMLKTGAAIAVLALGVLALGAAIVFLAGKILKTFKLDLKTVLETAAVVGAVALAGGAIAAAGIMVFQQLNSQEAKDFTQNAQKSAPDVLRTAAALMIIGPAIVLLGAAMVAMAGLILGKLNLNFGSVIEIAGVLVAVAGVAGAMAAGSAKFLECLDELKTNKTWKRMLKSPGKAAWDIAKAAAALLVIGGAIMLLGVALIKMGQLVMSVAGLDGSEAVKVGMQVAGLILAAGAIAGAIVGAAYGLKCLGEFAKKSTGYAKDMLIGGVALLIMAPAMTILAAGVAWMVSGIMSAFGMDAGVAAKVAFNVAGLILAAGLIAGAVIAAAAGLIALGALVTNLGAYTGGIGLGAAIGLMAAGGAALLLLTPAMLLLASGIVYIAQQIMSMTGIDLAVAAKVAKDLAGVLLAAGFIAVAILGSGWALAQLGALVWSGVIFPYIGLAVLGAAALLLLTPAVTALASAIIWMAGAVMKSVVDPAEASKTAEALASVIGAAAEISATVLAMGAALALLGLAMTYGIFWIIAGLAVLGAAAMLILTPAIVGLSVAIIKMAQAVVGKGVSPEEAKMVSEALASILDSAASISWSVIKSAATLGVLGLLAAFSVLAWIMMGAMYLGSAALQKLTPAVVDMAQTIINVAMEVIKKGVSPQVGKEVAEALSSILSSAASIADSVLDMVPKLGKLGILGFFAEFIAGLMYMGVEALQTLAVPVGQYIDAVVKIAKGFASSLDPAKAAEMAKGVGEVLGACGTVTDEIMKAKDRLTNIPVYGGFWAWLTGSKLSDRMREGVLALSDLAGPVGTYIQTVVRIAHQMGGSLDPKKAAEMARGVGEILGACGTVTDEIMKAKDKLLSVPVYGGFWAWLTGSKVADRMREGVFALSDLAGPAGTYIQTVVRIARQMGGSLDPKKAADMAKGVAAILSACGEVTDEIMKTKDKLLSMPSSKGFWSWLIGTVPERMREGVFALSEIAGPVGTYVQTVVRIARTIGGALDPRLAVSMAKGVAAILSACGEVTDEIMKSKDKLMSIKSSQGFWVWSVSIIDAMKAGVKSLEEMKQPIIDYIVAIVGFARDMQSKVDVKSAKSMVKSLQGVSMIVDLVAKVLNDVSTKITPLTQGTWFTASPIKQMTKAKNEMAVFFPALIDFIRMIVDKVKDSLGNIKELKSAAKSLRAMAMILNAALPAITIMGEKIAPLTQGGFFTKSPVEKIRGAIPQFDGFFEAVGEFVNKIVTAVATIKAGPELKEAAKKMVMMSLMLQETGKALTALSSVVGMMDGGFFTDSPIEKIVKNKNQFAVWFWQIAAFVNYGIVWPINRLMPDPKTLQNAAVVLGALSRVLCGTKVTLEKLAEVISLMEPKWFFQKAPIQKIIDNKDQFKTWFIEIANFVNSGIVAPVLNEFKDSLRIMAAAKIIQSMAVIARNVVPMIKNLAGAVALATDGASFFSVAPMQKIMESKKQFQEWFEAITKFVRDGIVDPVNKEMKGIDITSAAKTLTAMAKIAAQIVPVIKNLAGAMSLMSSPAERFFDTDFPIDKIMVYKGEFAMWFKSIAIFMRDGIVNPILEQLPNPKTIQTASQILAAMSRVVTLIPIVINKMANGLVPLIDSGMSLKDSPKEKLEGKTKIFQEWFTSVAKFMREGIVMPILNELPEPKTIMMASRILAAMSRIMTAIPIVIRKLSSLFVPLDPNKCLQESPVGMLAANAPMFAEWFWTVAAFIRVGILAPIMNLFPDEKEIVEVAGRLKATNTVVAMLTPFLYGLAATMSNLTGGLLFLSPMARIASKVSTFASYFYDIAAALIFGIFRPIMLGFPKTEDLEDVADRLKATVKAIDLIVPFLDDVGVSLDKLYKARWRNYFAAYDAESFAPYFRRITSAIGDGILRPMMTLPTSDEIGEINLQMDGMSKAIDSAGAVLTVAGTKMDKFAKSWFWRLMDGWKADQFGSTFMNMANAINRGILQPMKLLPSSNEINEVVSQLDGMVEVLNNVGTVLEAMSDAMLNIASADIDFSALDTIPIDKMAMFAGALRDMKIATSGGGIDVMGATGGGGGSGSGTPSDMAIETRMMKEQVNAQSSMATVMAELLNEAMRGEGLIVRDQLGLKMQRKMATIQQEEAHNALMPSAAQKQAMVQSIDTTRPAIQAVNPAPAAGNLDMRRASQTMRDTPEQRAMADERRERRERNPHTDRRAERAEARRLRREQAGFEGDATLTPENNTGMAPRGEGALRGEAHGTGMLTEQALAQAIEHQANEAQGGQPVGHRLANAASISQQANQGMMPNIPTPPMPTQIDSGWEDKLYAIVSENWPRYIPDDAIRMVDGVVQTPGGATMTPVPQTSPMMNDMHTAMQADKAVTQPTTTSMTAPELGDIADETSQQTPLLEKLVELFGQVLAALQPKSQPTTGTGGVAGDTNPHTIAHKPANYFRNTTGLVAQTAGKAVLNLGPPNA